MRAGQGFGLGLGIVVALLAAAAGCGDDGDDLERPGERGGVNYQPVDSSTRVPGERNFARLASSSGEGRVRGEAWAGYWWPYLGEGIALSASRYELASGGSGEAERWERRNHGSAVPGVESWWGHCNGWAAAAVLTREPRVARAAGGQSFSVADQKALYSELGMEVDADFFGRRSQTGDPGSPAFADVFPNQFLLVLMNYVGRGLPLVMDRYTGVQVWNHPIAGYRLVGPTPDDDLGPDPRFPGVHRLRFSVRVWWLRADVDPEHLTEPFTFVDGPSYESRTLRGEAWLDAPSVFDAAGRLIRSGDLILVEEQGVAIGGAWRNSGLASLDSHPDYLWVPLRFRPSSGYSNPAVTQAGVAALFGG